MIIPTWNRARTVVHAVESALSQTLRDLEVIVVDDGSDDGTRDALQPLLADDRVRCLVRPHSGLPGVARNAGLGVARGEAVAFLDSDDTWLPEKLERQLSALADDRVGLVCANAYVEGPSSSADSSSVRPYHEGKPGGLRALEDLVRDNVVITSTALVRRSVLDEVGWFSEDPRLRGNEDFDLWLRIAERSAILYIDEPLAVYRDSGSSLRGDVSLEQFHRALLLIFISLRRRVLHGSPSLLDDLDAKIEGLRRFLRDDLRVHLERGQWRSAKLLAAEITSANPRDLRGNLALWLRLLRARLVVR